VVIFGLIAFAGNNPTIGPARRLVNNARHANPDRVKFRVRGIFVTSSSNIRWASTGLFLILTSEPAEDIDIPGAGYTFGQLQLALALSDFQSLYRGEC